MSRSRPTLALLAWSAAPAAGLLVLRALGHGLLSAPPVAHPGLLPGWASSRDPSVAAMALLRLIGMGACWYLLAVVALGVAVRLAGVPGLIRAADLFTAAPIRRVLHASLGAGVILAAWAGPASAAALPRIAHHAPVLRRLEDPPPSSLDPAGPDLPAEPAAPDAAAQPLPPEAPDSADPNSAADPAAAPDSAPDPAAAPDLAPQSPGDPSPAPQPDGPSPEQPDATPDPAPAPAPAPAPSPDPPSPSSDAGSPSAPSPAPAPAASATWTVSPGDSFWHIAAAVLARHHPRPSRGQLTAYWDALVKANHDRLVHPGNPDLIYAGQQFVLPPPPL